AVALIVLTYGFRHELDNTLDGLIYGGLIGIGFAFSENLLYFEESFKRYGMGGLGTLFVMRVLIGGWGHCVYTGMVGAAIGWSRTQYRRGFVRFVVPALVLLLAIALHTAWNWAALINAQSANSIEHAFVLQAIVAVIVILPGLLLLFLVAKESQRRQLQIVREQLKEEVSTGHLTAAEYAVLSSDDLRGRALRHAKAVDSQLATDLKRFLNTAVELAFLKQHIEKGETLDDRRAIMLERYRRILADLRPGLLPLQRTS
ncbi:MAG: PrsW family glutamic-type intramembrane protease, partial [Chloroflexota bacterium]